MSVILAALNTPDHNNDANYDDADSEDAVGKKTLMTEGTAAGTGGGASELAVIFPLRDNEIGGGQYDSASVLSVAPRSHNDDEAPRHRPPSHVHAWTTMAPWRSR